MGLFLKKKQTQAASRNVPMIIRSMFEDTAGLNKTGSERPRMSLCSTPSATDGRCKDQPGKHCYWLDGCFDSLIKGCTHCLVSRSWYSSSKSKHSVVSILCWPSAVHSSATGSWVCNVRQWWLQIKTSKGNRYMRGSPEEMRCKLPVIFFQLSHTGTCLIFSAAIWYVTTHSECCHQAS